MAAMASVGGTITALLDLNRLVRNAPEDAAAGEADSEGVRGFHDNIDPADLEIFRERAERLRERTGAADMAGQISLAVVSLGDELFGIGLESVREFAECGDVAAVPCSPPHIVGLSNLRGEILTVADIRGELGIPAAERVRGKNIVVVQAGELRAGIAVDEIISVIHVPSGDILRTGRSARAGDSEGGASVLHEGRVVRLLDIQGIITSGKLHVEEEVA